MDAKQFQEKWNEMEARLKELTDEAKMQERIKGVVDPLIKVAREAIKADMAKLTDAVKDVEAKAAVKTASKTQTDKSEYKQAFFNYLKTGEGDQRVKELYKQEPSVFSVSGNEFIVPADIDRRISLALEQRNHFRNPQYGAEIVSSGVDYRKMISHEGVSGWAGSSDARTGKDSPTMSKVDVKYGELYTYFTMENHAIDDAAFNLEQALVRQVEADFVKEEYGVFVSGNGSDKPKGILAYDTSETPSWGEIEHLVTATSGDLDYAGINLLYYGLHESLRGPAVFIVNPQTLARIRSLEDSFGSLIWKPEWTNTGIIDKLLGKPVIESDSVPVIAGNANAVIFANLQEGYFINDVRATRMIRDNITRPGFTKIYSYKRVGGAVSNFNAIKVLKINDQGS